MGLDDIQHEGEKLCYQNNISCKILFAFINLIIKT